MRARETLRAMTLTALLCAAFILVFIVFPSPSAYGSRLIGTVAFHHDAFLNAGVLEWGFRSLWTSGRQFFEWNAGFPLTNSLAGTENLIGWQVLYSPLRMAGLGVPAAYNTLLFVSLILSGAGTAALAVRLGSNTWGAIAAGLAFAFNPFHLNHAVHLQTMAVFAAPFAILFWDRFLSSRSTSDALSAAAFTLLTFLCGIYVGVMLGVVLIIYSVFAVRRVTERSPGNLLPGILIAVVFVVIALIPLLVHYVEFGNAHGFYRHSSATLSRFSIHLGGFARAPMWQAALRETPLAAKGFDALSAAFPGIAVLVLSAIALKRREPDDGWRRITVCLAWCAAIPALLAMGPSLKLRTEGIIEPVSWLPMPGAIWLLVPGIRWPMRIYLFTGLFAAILAGLGLSRLTRSAGVPARNAIGAVIIVLLIIELHPGRAYVEGSAKASDPSAATDAYAFLSSEADTGGVAELPVADATGYRTPMLTRYIYASAGHLRRVVAFHGSVIPPVIHELRAAIDSLPSPAAEELLRKLGVTRVIVHRELMEPEAAATRVAAFKNSGMEVLYDRGKSVVFSIESRDRR